MKPENPFEGLALRCPEFTSDEAGRIARELFGIDGTVKELGSNQDRNYRIDSAEGRFVLKIANPGWERVALEAQNAAMLHLASRNLPFDVPVPRAAPGGELIVVVERDGARYDTRLVSYVEGEPLQAAGHCSAAALQAVGRLAGETVRALADFSHAGLERTIQWNLKHAGEVVAALAHVVTDLDHRAQAVRMMAQAEALLEPLRAELPLQAVHSDCTDYNVMAAPDRAGRAMPTGLIDFGDLVSSYRISDIATAVQSLVLNDPAHALEIATEIARGFDGATELTDAELAALWPLVLARAAVCAICEEQQAVLEPENVYAQTFLGDGWLIADGLEAIPPELAHEALRAALGRGPSAASRAAAACLADLAPQAVLPLAAPLGELLDLSSRSELLQDGCWLDPTEARAAIAAAGAAIGRFGEGRLVHAAPNRRDPPPSVHLGVDLFAAPGSPIAAPLAGTVVRSGTRELVLDLGGLGLRLAGIASPLVVGTTVAAGDALGTVASTSPEDPLPAHLHLQVLADPALAAPGLAVPAQAAGWRALCPDPSPLLGRECAAPLDDPARLAARRNAVVASVQEHYFSEPPEIERGWRHHLYDTDGRAYLDGVNNVAILGHSHPGVATAVARQLRLLNTNSRFHYDVLVQLSERLVARTPAGLDSVFLVGSGSEANDLALRLVRCFTGCRDVITIQSAYHGWTAATDEVSTALYDNPLSAEKRPPWVHPVESPNAYRGEHRGSDAGQRYAADVDRALAEIRAAGNGVAGLIAEALYGNAGGVPLPAGYLELVYAAVRADGGLCIADEVQVGYGRLGEFFWGFEQQGVVPDVITIAKATGNGFPVGAVITTRAIAERFAREGSFFSSTGGSPASCAAALAVLDALEREGLQENARRVGAHLRRRLEELCERHPICGAIHGMGLYLGLELVRDRETLEPAGDETYAICERLRELGVIMQPTSDGMNVLKIKPPLCLDVSSADFLADTIDHVLSTGW